MLQCTAVFAVPAAFASAIGTHRLRDNYDNVRKKLVSILMVEEGNDRVIQFTYSDGSIERKAAPKKTQTRRPRRPSQRAGMNRTRQKQY
jgi:hypothetical protein